MSEDEILTLSKSYYIKGLDNAASMIRDASTNNTLISTQKTTLLMLLNKVVKFPSNRSRHLQSN